MHDDYYHIMIISRIGISHHPEGKSSACTLKLTTFIVTCREVFNMVKGHYA